MNEKKLAATCRSYSQRPCRWCTARSGIVLDPFLGSGTTVIAAERTARVCYGIELNPLRVDTIVRRWQAFTGESAVEESTGKTFSEIEEGHHGRAE